MSEQGQNKPVRAPAKKRAAKKQASKKSAAKKPAAVPPPDVAESADDVAKLKQLGELHKAGILTDAEFAAKKRQLIGKPLRTSSGWASNKKLLGGLLAAVVILVGGGIGLKLKHDHDESVKAEQKADAARHRREAAKRRAAARAKAQDDLNAAEIGIRESTVRSLRASVTKDFKSRVARGDLDGPIRSTSCDPISGGPDELDEDIGQFQCFVKSDSNGDGTYNGYNVKATVNYDEASYTWNLSVGN